MVNPPNPRGPRLGKLKGLRNPEDEQTNGDPRHPSSKKEGIKVGGNFTLHKYVYALYSETYTFGYLGAGWN